MINSKKYASNKKTQVLGYKHGRFWGSVGMGIPWEFPRDFAVGMGWVWRLKSNPHGSPAGFGDYSRQCGQAIRLFYVRSPDYGKFNVSAT